MVSYDEIDHPALNLPLNEKFYDLGEDEIAFYKALTGIASDDELKQHIISVQREAYTVSGLYTSNRVEAGIVIGYRCFRILVFAGSLSQSRCPHTLARDVPNCLRVVPTGFKSPNSRSTQNS